MRVTVADDIAAGSLIQVLPKVAMVSIPVHVLHAFGRRLPVRARLFVDFLVEQIREPLRSIDQDEVQSRAHC